jgi:serine/threonine-protein kinase HipA
MGLSLGLPLQGEAFEDQQCRAFFAGLLPEGQLRQLIAQQFQISRQNDFGLLEVIGATVQER